MVEKEDREVVGVAPTPPMMEQRGVITFGGEEEAASALVGGSRGGFGAGDSSGTGDGWVGVGVEVQVETVDPVSSPSSDSTKLFSDVVE